jgi:hypothetical protein
MSQERIASPDFRALGVMQDLCKRHGALPIEHATLRVQNDTEN